MTIGDKATAKGLQTWTNAQDRRLGFQNDNQRGDDIALTTAFSAGSMALRDAFWGIPATATDRLALQNLGAITTRLDKGRTERYYAGLTDGGSNPGGKATPGWYHIAGKPEIGTLPLTAPLTSYSLTKSNGIVTAEVDTTSLATGGILIATLPLGFRPPAVQRGGAWGLLTAGSVPIAASSQILTTGEVYGYVASSATGGFSTQFTFVAVDTPLAD